MLHLYCVSSGWQSQANPGRKWQKNGVKYRAKDELITFNSIKSPLFDKKPYFLAEKGILCYNIGKLLKYERFT